MEALDAILADWRACDPDGACLAAGRAGIAVDRVVSRVHAEPLSEAAFQDVHVFLSPPVGRNSGPSPFVKMLRIGADGQTAGDDQLNFLRFWQASEEVWRRVQQFNSPDDEPVVEEIAALRDSLLRSSDGGHIKVDWLASEVADTRSMSVDRQIWQSLEHSIELLALSKVDLTDMESKSSPCSLATFMLEEASMLLLTWIFEIVHDYCHGDRFAKIQAVRHVASCTRRTACFHLASSDWDVEAALLSFFGSAWETSSSWSSQGAKLRKDEVECPICTLPYNQAAKSLVTSCCFQVLCTACCSKLTDAEGVFQCPFCRGCKRHSKPGCRRSLVPSARRAFDGVLRFAGRTAERAASDAGQLLGEFAMVFREADGSSESRPHARSSAVIADEPPLVQGVHPYLQPQDHRGSRNGISAAVNSAVADSPGLSHVTLLQTPPVFRGPRYM